MVNLLYSFLLLFSVHVDCLLSYTCLYEPEKVMAGKSENFCLRRLRFSVLSPEKRPGSFND